MNSAGTDEGNNPSDGVPAFDDMDPRLASKLHFDQRIAQGATEDTAAAEALNFLAQAAMRGDPRVIVDNPRDWQRQPLPPLPRS
jgi:hypothetical protein